MLKVRRGTNWGVFSKCPVRARVGPGPNWAGPDRGGTGPGPGRAGAGGFWVSLLGLPGTWFEFVFESCWDRNKYPNNGTETNGNCT